MQSARDNSNRKAHRMPMTVIEGDKRKDIGTANPPPAKVKRTKAKPVKKGK